MNRKTALESLGMRPLMWAALAAAALTIGACSSDKKQTADADAMPAPPPMPAGEAPPTQNSGLVTGGLQPGGKFKSSGNFIGKGTPDVNTVPTEVPKPPSTKEDRAKAIEGLIADRTNARYTDQGGRTLPVAVRPLVDTPETAQTDAVARLDTPAPERPAEPAVPAPEPLPLPNTVQSDVGPQSPGAAPRRRSAGGETEVAANGQPTKASLGGFHPLAEFETAVYSKSTLAGTVAVQSGNLNANDRNVLNTTARQQIDSRGKGVVRIVGHGNGGLERAMIAAKELQRLGVAQNNIYVGVDNITGPTEVFFDRSK